MFTQGKLTIVTSHKAGKSASGTPASRKPTLTDKTLDYLVQSLREGAFARSGSGPLLPVGKYNDYWSTYQPKKELTLRSPLEQWKRLEDVTKLHLLAMSFLTRNGQAVSINISSEKLNEWTSRHKPIAKEIRDSLSKIVRQMNLSVEYAFVIEGHDRDGVASKIHLHGIVAASTPEDMAGFKLAIAKACGHDRWGRGVAPKARHFQDLRDCGWVDYIMKAIGKHRTFLGERRVFFSRGATQRGRSLYEQLRELMQAHRDRLRLPAPLAIAA